MAYGQPEAVARLREREKHAKDQFDNTVGGTLKVVGVILIIPVAISLLPSAPIVAIL